MESGVRFSLEPAAAPQPAFLSILHLSKHYSSGKSVLRDLSFSAASGEFISVLGESGCGKSTLLKMIAGLVSISDGTIRIGGMVPENARELMSYVFQDATLLPWRTVAGNVELALEFNGLPRPLRAARVAAVLALVGLSKVSHYYPQQLSGGMKMRVSIARALATSPRLLLMDEPFGALDAMTRNRLNEELLSLEAQQHRTTVFVTHSISEAVFLSDRILLLGTSPDRVCEDIPIRLPAPRTAALRSDAAYLHLVGEVSRAFAALHA